MKVVTAKEMARIEALAIQKGCDEEGFIRQAGRRVAETAAEWIQRHRLAKKIVILAGKGNKGADAFAAGVILLLSGFHVRAYHLAALEQSKPFCRLFAKYFCQKGGERIEIQNATSIDLKPDCLVIDGLLGTGFAGRIEGLFKDAIRRVNESRSAVLSIDVPSGLDGSTGEAAEDGAIHADLTVALGLPKAGCFLGDGWNKTGQLHIGDFGLPQEYVDMAEEIAFLPDLAHMKTLLPALVRNRHKYQAGCVVGFAGSEQYSGAAKLASYAALRSGAGIVLLYYPLAADAKMAGCPCEVICMPWTDEAWKESLQKARSVLIGPGLGRSDEIRRWIKKRVPAISLPVVLDADALIPSLQFPPNAVCTPHRQEMLRLLGLKQAAEEELLKGCQRFSNENKTVVVLKGAPSWIFIPFAKPVIIARGDPGMATAGSGDVLTGLIAALLAQGCSRENAAVLGAFLHALSGEAAAKEKTSYCMVAGDLIEFLPKAFQELLAEV